MTRLVRRFAAASVLALAGATTARAQDSTLQRALRDELDRSIRDLRLGQLARPYFIAYRAFDASGFDASATGGSLLSSASHHSRNVDPEVRVGDYAFDNTNFMNFGGGMVAISFGGGGDEFEFGVGSLPLDENYLEIRRQVWLLTDAAYKQAAETFAAKRAALLNRSRRDSLPDFSRAAPTHTVDTLPAIELDRAAGESLVRALSAVPELARLARSGAKVSVGNPNAYLINSEGTTAFVRHPLIALSVSASTQAADGAPLGASLRVYARSAQALPSREQLTRDVRALAMRLDSLRAAPVLERYNGPVLFDGRAAAELFAERFAPALVGRRTPEGGSDFATMMEATGRGVTSFTERVRSRVLPSFLSVVDDPTVTEQDGVPLLGAYRVDADGVLARRKLLVENGIVKQVLTSRVPVHGALESTGNRRGDGAAPSNVLVTSTTSLTDGELKNRLLALVKQRGLEYGVIVRELGSAASNRDDPSDMMMDMRNRGAGRAVLLAYRVYPDGHEELVRGARLMDVNAESFKDIVAVSTRATILHRPTFGVGNFPFPAPMEMLESLGDDTGAALPLASYVVPSLLFEDISIERSSGEQPRPPLSPPPA